MRQRLPVVFRALVVLVASVATFASIPSCTVSEGERCNPSRQPDECAEGTTCVVPKGCVIAVCCPLSGSGRAANCGPNPPCLVDAAADAAGATDGGDSLLEAADARPDGADASVSDASTAGPDANEASAD